MDTKNTDAEDSEPPRLTEFTWSNFEPIDVSGIGEALTGDSHEDMELKGSIRELIREFGGPDNLVKRGCIKIKIVRNLDDVPSKNPPNDLFFFFTQQSDEKNEERFGKQFPKKYMSHLVVDKNVGIKNPRVNLLPVKKLTLAEKALRVGVTALERTMDGLGAIRDAVEDGTGAVSIIIRNTRESLKQISSVSKDKVTKGAMIAAAAGVGLALLHASAGPPTKSTFETEPQKVSPIKQKEDSQEGTVLHRFVLGEERVIKIQGGEIVWENFYENMYDLETAMADTAVAKFSTDINGKKHTAEIEISRQNLGTEIPVSFTPAN